MNANGWHYAQGEKTFGPVDLKELQVVLSRISDPRNLLVWRTGFEGWQRAGSVPELAQFIDKPPPLPQPSQPRKKWSLWRAALYGALFSLALRLFYIATGDITEPFLPPLNALGIAELIGYLIPGAIIFVMIADITNRRRSKST
jgi:GYF domain 2